MSMDTKQVAEAIVADLYANHGLGCDAQFRAEEYRRRLVVNVASLLDEYGLHDEQKDAQLAEANKRVEESDKWREAAQQNGKFLHDVRARQQRAVERAMQAEARAKELEAQLAEVNKRSARFEELHDVAARMRDKAVKFLEKAEDRVKELEAQLAEANKRVEVAERAREMASTLLHIRQVEAKKFNEEYAELQKDAAAQIEKAEASVKELEAENVQLKLKLARIDDIRETLAMDFTKVVDEDEEVVMLFVSPALWDALVSNMESFSKGDLDANKCWPRSVWQEFRDDYELREIENLRAEVELLKHKRDPDRPQEIAAWDERAIGKQNERGTS